VYRNKKEMLQIKQARASPSEVAQKSAFFGCSTLGNVAFVLVQEAYENQTKEVNDSMIELQKCMHLIEEMQRELEARSSTNSNHWTYTTRVGPVVKIRTAMADLKADMKKIDVRLGITRHQLLHLQLQNHCQPGG
jgi:hypothetical protein